MLRLRLQSATACAACQQQHAASCLQVFDSPAELWRAQDAGEVPKFGAPAVAYWDSQEASDNGVLGGYGHLSGPDVRDSRTFLKKVRVTFCFPFCIAV